MPRAYRAGEAIEDACRACKTDRLHTVVVVDPTGTPIRVTCDYCHSEHNYRGGARLDTGGILANRPVRAAERSSSDQADFPLVSERERTATPMTAADPSADLELLLRRIIREEAGVTPVTPAAKWRGGTLVLRPGQPGLQEKSWPIETFFHKIVMLRNRLRTLEQQLSGCYGTLTSFNVLFANEPDQFKGSGGD
jgi:hypothetical protein